MKAEIKRNTARNSIQIFFEKKPDANTLAYLHSLKMQWQPYEKYWYIKYSEEMLNELTVYFEDKEVEADTFKPEIEKPKIRKLNLEFLMKNKKAPRKDVILSEIQAGKMECAEYKHFNGMNDSTEYNKVDNDSFSPAEDDSYLINNLNHAIGQAHRVYSAYVSHSNLLGYYISFSDYYIRYKGSKGKTFVQQRAESGGMELKQGDVLLEKEGLKSFWFISKVFEGSDLSNPEYEAYQVWSYGFNNENGRFGVKKDIPLNFFSEKQFEKSTEGQLLFFMSVLNWNLHDTYQNFYGGMELSDEKKMKILEVDKTPIAQEILRIIKSVKPPDEKKSEPKTKTEPLFMGITEDEFIVLDITRALKPAYREKYFRQWKVFSNLKKIQENLYKKGYLLKNTGITPEGMALHKKIMKDAVVSQPYFTGYEKVFMQWPIEQTPDIEKELNEKETEPETIEIKAGDCFREKDSQYKTHYCVDHESYHRHGEFVVYEASIYVTGQNAGQFTVRTQMQASDLQADWVEKIDYTELDTFIMNLDWNILNVYKDNTAREISPENKLIALKADTNRIAKDVLQSMQNTGKMPKQEHTFKVGDMVELIKGWQVPGLAKDTMVFLSAGFQGKVLEDFFNPKGDEYVVVLSTEKNDKAASKQHLIPANRLMLVSEIKTETDEYTVLPNDVIVFKSKEEAKAVLSKYPVLETAYSVSYISDHYTQVQLGEKMPSGYYATKERPGKGNELPFIALTQSKLESYINEPKSFMDYYVNPKNEVFTREGVKVYTGKDETDARAWVMSRYETIEETGQKVEDILKGEGMKPDTGQRAEPQYHVGDKVELIENYFTTLKGSWGEVVSTRMEGDDEMVRILFGKNQSGQRIENTIAAWALKKIETEIVPEPETKTPDDAAKAKIKARARAKALILILELEEQERERAKAQPTSPGKKITPHPEVSLNYAAIVKDVIQGENYRQLDYEDGMFLSQLFWDYKRYYDDDLERSVVYLNSDDFTKQVDESDHSGINIEFYDKNVKTDEQKKAYVREKLAYLKDIWYIYFEIDYRNSNVTLEEKGVDFIEACIKRSKTREQVRLGIDLFPGSAGIPELKETEEFQEGGNIEDCWNIVENRPIPVSILRRSNGAFVIAVEPMMMKYETFNKLGDNLNLDKDLQKRGMEFYPEDMKYVYMNDVQCSFYDYEDGECEFWAGSEESLKNWFTLYKDIVKRKSDEIKDYAEGGDIPISKQFRATYELVSKASAVNVTKFAREINVLNQYNKIIFDFLGEHRVPLIKVDKERLKTDPLFKLIPAPEKAIFWCLSGMYKGNDLNNIYISVLPNSYLGIGDYAIKMGVPYDEILENAFTHEAIHSYNHITFKDNPAFKSEAETLKEYMNLKVRMDENTDRFFHMVWNNIYGTPMQIAQGKQPSIEELITYPLTMVRVKEAFDRIKLNEYGGISAWQRLINLISIHDKFGMLVMYANKYGDIPEDTFEIAALKYKLFLKKKENPAGISMKEDGGLVQGASHDNGGVKMDVQSTGEKVELEGGEAVIKKTVVHSNKTYQFEGKKQTPKQILNKLNTDGGGNPI